MHHRATARCEKRSPVPHPISDFQESASSLTAVWQSVHQLGGLATAIVHLQRCSATHNHLLKIDPALGTIGGGSDIRPFCGAGSAAVSLWRGESLGAEAVAAVVASGSR